MILLLMCSMSFVFRQKLSTLKKIPVLSNYEEYIFKEMKRDIAEKTSYLKHTRLIDFAFELAFLAHYGQFRADGQHYITHPHQVALKLANNKMDSQTVIAGLLHDSVEDTFVSFDDIERMFDSEVKSLVEGVTKVSKLKKSHFNTHDEENMENMRSLFMSMAKDWRVVIIKLADRLHNMQTLEHLPLYKQIKISQETLDVFVPIAHRLGLWHYRCELGDLAFKYVDASSHAIVTSYIEGIVQHSTRYLDFIVETLKKQLEGFEVDITFRTKCKYSIHSKMLRRKLNIQDIQDIFALRIIVQEEDPSLCYRLMEYIETYWDVIPGSVKDYIARPKQNGYKSLQFTLKISEEDNQYCTRFIEIQIRTKHMHMVAEYGSAAHWIYHTNHPAESWRNITSKMQSKSYYSTFEYVDLIQNELGSNVYVYMDDGIKKLCQGACVKDAIKMLHSKPSWEFVIQRNEKIATDLDLLENGDSITLRPRYFDEFKRLCEICWPLPGDYLFFADGMIHREGCQYMSHDRKLNASVDCCLHEDLYRNIEDNVFETHILITSKDRLGILLEIVQEITKHVHNIIDVRTTNFHGISKFHFRLHVHKKDEIDEIINAISEVQGVMRIQR